MYFISLLYIRRAAPPPREKSLGLKGTLYSLITGFAGGITATACNAPFDVCKSRIQAQPARGHRKYTSTLQALSHIAREEGSAALYKGFFPKALRMGIGG